MSPLLHVDRWDPVLGQIHDTEVHLRLLRQTEGTAELRRDMAMTLQGKVNGLRIAQNLVAPENRGEGRQGAAVRARARPAKSVRQPMPVCDFNLAVGDLLASAALPTAQEIAALLAILGIEDD